MIPERWRLIRDLFSSALQLGAAERSAFLDRNCSGDPSLRQEVCDKAKGSVTGAVL
jgi:hypothetical protein